MRLDETRVVVIGIGIVVVCGLVIAALSAERSPSTIDDAAATLKQLCTRACESASSASATLRLSPGTRVYTTDEAICAQAGQRISCGRCPCALAAGGEFSVATNVNAPADVVCSLSPENATAGATLALTCAFTVS